MLYVYSELVCVYKREKKRGGVSVLVSVWDTSPLIHAHSIHAKGMMPLPCISMYYCHVYAYTVLYTDIPIHKEKVYIFSLFCSISFLLSFHLALCHALTLATSIQCSLTYTRTQTLSHTRTCAHSLARAPTLSLSPLLNLLFSQLTYTV